LNFIVDFKIGPFQSLESEFVRILQIEQIAAMVMETHYFNFNLNSYCKYYLLDLQTHFRKPLGQMVYLFFINFIIIELVTKTYYFEYHFQILSFEFQINFAKRSPIKIDYSKLVHLIKCCLMQQTCHLQNEH
jgi:hypothetical protein